MDKIQNLHEALIFIQNSLKVNKSKSVSLGNSRNFKYRTAEDIMEAVKPLLEKTGCTLVLNNVPKEYGGVVYCITTAILSRDGNSVTATGFARENTSDFVTKQYVIQDKRLGEVRCEAHQSLDQIVGGQASGAAISYAEKYALGGLFLIDDGIDLDSTTPQKTQSSTTPQKSVEDYISEIKELYNKGNIERAMNGIKFIKKTFPKYDTSKLEEYVK